MANPRERLPSFTEQEWTSTVPLKLRQMAAILERRLQELENASGEAGEGVPIGGNVGDFLRKVSITDFDTEWATVTATSSHSMAYFLSG